MPPSAQPPLSPPATAGAPQDLPHDIAEIIPYQLGWSDLWPWLAAASLVALVCLLGWLWWRRHRERNRKNEPVVPSEPFPVTVRRRLRDLTPTGEFSSQREQREYFFALSLLLREVIEHCFSVRATDMTFSELKPTLHRLQGIGEREGVLLFLQRADLIKYAERSSCRKEAEEFHGLCRKWIEAWLLHAQQGDAS